MDQSLGLYRCQILGYGGRIRRSSKSRIHGIPPLEAWPGSRDIAAGFRSEASEARKQLEPIEVLHVID